MAADAIDDPYPVRRKEITAEALTRNIPAFSRFLQIAALTNGELTNYNKKIRWGQSRWVKMGTGILCLTTKVV